MRSAIVGNCRLIGNNCKNRWKKQVCSIYRNVWENYQCRWPDPVIGIFASFSLISMVIMDIIMSRDGTDYQNILLHRYLILNKQYKSSNADKKEQQISGEKVAEHYFEYFVRYSITWKNMICFVLPGSGAWTCAIGPKHIFTLVWTSRWDFIRPYF